MKVPEVELSKCILCELCTDLCPEVFVLNDSGYVEIRELEVYPEESVLEALKHCPADCITFEE